MARLSTIVALAGSLATLVACGGGVAPVLSALEDQEVAVGTELVIELIGTDEDGDELFYSFAADVPDINDRATVTRRPDGAGMFRWTPLAQDVGPWFFDFSVTDGSDTATETIQIEVKSAIGVNSAPVFREPLGTGTTLDLSQEECVDVKVVVEDQDSTSVVIAQGSPYVEGSTMQSSGSLTATWHWCPTPAQIEADDRYTLVLEADDLNNPKTVKHYLIVLRKELKPDCPGEAPLISHTPADESTLLSLVIDANISDDVGLKSSPLFYYSATDPGSTPNLADMTQASMILVSGSMQSGSWAADVPNPVVGLPQGSSAELYYLITALDDDDSEGDCDHLTQAPTSATYSMTVTNPGGSGGAGVCEPCTADIQCGGAGDLCVRVGTGGDAFCLEACGSCPTNYSCSTGEVESVEGTMATQCVPNSNDCSNPGGVTCDDDSYEDNDSREEASTNPALDTGFYELTSCPSGEYSDDEDWFKFIVSADSEVSFTLVGDTTSDLDLAIYDSTGSLVKSSASLDAEEEIVECVTAGTYYVRIYAWSAAENNYLFEYSSTAMSCGSATCVDDTYEEDDASGSAHELDFLDINPGPWISDARKICADDDDWFMVSLVDGDMLTVDLTFVQDGSDQDLDLHFIDPDLVDLTPCSVEEPEDCSTAQGQSATSNEHYEFTLSDASCTVSAMCDHYIVVRGYDGAHHDNYTLGVSLTLP